MKLRTLLRIVLVSIIPALLAFSGKDNGLLDEWHKSGVYAFNPAPLKNLLLIIGILIPAGYYPIYIEWTKNRMEQVFRRRFKIIANFTAVFKKALEDKLGNPNVSSMNVRFWIRRSSRWGGKVEFRIRNVEGLAYSANTDGLVLQAYPEVQGVVGHCFKNKDIVLEEDLASSSTDYRLNHFQKSKVGAIRFCMAVPLFDAQNNVSAIITLDSDYKIAVPNAQKSDIITLTAGYCQTLYESCPDLFE